MQSTWVAVRGVLSFTPGDLPFPQGRAISIPLQEITMVSTTTPTGNATDIAVGKLALEFCDKALPLRVLRSQRGFYIGTLNGRLAHAL